MPDLIHPHDDARGDVHPLPLSRRKFLTRSAAAVAGGVLFSCTGRCFAAPFPRTGALA